MRVLYVYKLNPQDPTELALRKWFLRGLENTEVFAFTNLERNRNSDFNGSALARLQQVVERHGSTHVFCWVPYLIPAEVKWLQARGIKVAVAVNGITSISHGYCPDQSKLFDYLRLLDWYFVPHRPHVELLKQLGVNVAELPFCYDDEVYRPLPVRGALQLLAPYQGSYIGNFGDKTIAQGRYRANVLQHFVGKFSMLAVCDSRYREHGLSGRGLFRMGTLTSSKALNWVLNSSKFTLGTDAFPEIDSYYKTAYANPAFEYDRERDGFVMRPRSFWSMGSGAPFVVENYPEIRRFFTHGENALFWNSPTEAVEMVAEFSRSPEKLKAIGAKGHLLVKRLHSARIRVKQIAGILSGGRVPDFSSGELI